MTGFLLPFHDEAEHEGDHLAFSFFFFVFFTAPCIPNSNMHMHMHMQRHARNEGFGNAAQERFMMSGRQVRDLDQQVRQHEMLRVGVSFPPFLVWCLYPCPRDVCCLCTHASAFW